jgi:hypothetical protein
MIAIGLIFSPSIRVIALSIAAGPVGHTDIRENGPFRYR